MPHVSPFVMRFAEPVAAAGLPDWTPAAGEFASLTNAVAEVSGGTYAVDLTASEMTADNVTLMFAATGAKTLTVTIRTDP